MAAPVRLEGVVFTDPRVSALASLLKLERRATAVGLLAELYSWQTENYTDERPTYSVPRAILVGIFGADGPQALVDADLAELQSDGRYRIRGADAPNGKDGKTTRVNWWHKGKIQRSNAGTKSAAARANGQEPRGSRGQFVGGVVERPPNDSLTKPNDSLNGHRTATERPPNTLVSDLCSQDPDLSHHAREGQGDPEPMTDAMAGSEQDVPGKPDEPPPARGQDSILALLAEAAAALNAARAIHDASAPPIDDSTAGAVTQRLMATPIADRRRKLMHAVACVVARAKATRSIEPLRWSTFGSEQAWAYVVDASVAEYARSGQRPGHGARDSPARHQPAPPARRTPIRDL